VAPDQQPARLLRRVAPAVGLLLLAPLVGEYLLGNVSIVEIAALPILALLYGSGAVLIREVARRTGRGWPTILALGLAYGLIEAGLIDQTLFNASQLTGDAVGAAAYVPALGISVSDLLSFVVGHAVWSIAVPIAMVEALVPGRRTTPWLGRGGLAVTGVLYLLGAVLVFRYMQQDSGGFLAPAPKLAAVAVVSAGLIGLAFAVGRRPRPSDRPAGAAPVAGRRGHLGGIVAVRMEGRELGGGRVRRGGGGRDGGPGRPLVPASRLGRRPLARPGGRRPGAPGRDRVRPDPALRPARPHPRHRQRGLRPRRGRPAAGRGPHRAPQRGRCRS
jgi:hypothetical protein